jgi:hypothetical protein
MLRNRLTIVRINGKAVWGRANDKNLKNRTPEAGVGPHILFET